MLGESGSVECRFYYTILLRLHRLFEANIRFDGASCSSRRSYPYVLLPGLLPVRPLEWGRLAPKTYCVSPVYLPAAMSVEWPSRSDFRASASRARRAFAQ